MMRQDQQILPSLISNQENRCLNVQLPYQNKKNFMYGSLITVPTSRNQKLKEMNSRIQQFCQQEKLLAEKGVQLQYLAQQKKQHMGQNDSFFSDIHSMENKVTQFQLQVENLRHENRTQRFLLNQKDKIIQNLREQNLNLNHELNESRSKIIALRQLQQSVFSFLTQIYIISNQLPELYEKLNNHRENLAKTIQILRAYKKENTAMRSHLQTLTNEAKLNQQFMDSRITQRKSLLEQKTKLFLLNIELQEKITAKNRQISNLNRKIDRDLQQKLEKEFQVKRMKKLIEEQTNYLKEEITKITQVVRKGYKEHQRIEEKSKKKYQFVVEDKMNVIRILEKRLKELQQSMTIKDERIDRLELIIKRHADRSSRIVSMANQFSPFFNKIEARVEKNNRVLEQVISQRGQLIDENDLMN